MRISALSTILVVLLLITIVLPSLCLAVPAESACAGASEIPGRSHGDHCPASQSPLTCCQVDHQIAMTVPVANLSVSPALMSDFISDADDNPANAVARFAAAREFTPQPLTVLRI